MTPSIQLDIDADRFSADVKSAVETFESRTLQTAISDIVADHYTLVLDSAIESKRILRYSPFRTVYSIDYTPPACLDGLLKRKWVEPETLAITVVVPVGLGSGVTFLPPQHVRWQIPYHFEKGDNPNPPRAPEVTVKNLKTVSRVTIRLFDTALPSRLLLPVRESFPSKCDCQRDLLTPYVNQEKARLLEFFCAVCGKIYYCACFRQAMKKWYMEALSLRDTYAEGSAPHLISDGYENFEYRENICHLCREIPSDLVYCAPMYGSEILVRYGPYINRIAAEEGMEARWRGGRLDRSEAENAIRDLLGVPRIGEGWVSEMELLRLVRAALPGEAVEHQASPDWLGRQKLDIFAPRLRLAIEYQGRQHFEPVEFFGGEAGLARNQTRDERKRQLCEENGIRLVYFRFDEDLSLSTVTSRLKAALRNKLIAEPR